MTATPLTHDISEDAAALYGGALVWDEHAGIGYQPVLDLSQLRIWRDAGVDYLSLNIGWDVLPWTSTIAAIAAFRRWILDNGEAFCLVETTDEIEAARGQGRMALTFDIEGMESLNENLDMVEFYYRLGVRHMNFAYNRNNAAGGGCHDEDCGLTDFGRAVVAEMNRVGMVVDCSHNGFRTTMEAMEISKAPVIFSHSNARALCDHERNIVDEQIKACAATGGVIGVVWVRILIGGSQDIAALADHIDHIAKLVGPRHIGLASDYRDYSFDDLKGRAPGADPGSADRASAYFPLGQYAGLVRPYALAPDILPRLTDELLRRGYAAGEVQGILGGNFMRVAKEVWKPCRSGSV